MHKHIRKVSYADLNQIYTTDKKGNKIPMKWYQSGSSINQQGMPFEHYIGTQLPAGSKLPDGFKTFDYYDSKDKIAQFKNYSRDDVPLRTDNIKKRVLHIGLPEKTTPEQWKSINSAVKNANDKNIDIKITIIKGD